MVATRVAYEGDHLNLLWGCAPHARRSGLSGIAVPLHDDATSTTIDFENTSGVQ